MRHAHIIAREFLQSLLDDGFLEDTSESSIKRKTYSITTAESQFRQNIEWLKQPTHTDPIVISLKLKFLSELKKAEAADPLKFSPAFISALENSKVKELKAIAQFSEEIAPQPLEYLSKDPNHLLAQMDQKTIAKNLEFIFSSIAKLPFLRQPTYFAQTILLYVASIKRIKLELIKNISEGTIPSESAMKTIARNSLMNEYGFVFNTRAYFELYQMIEKLQTDLKKKLHDLPEENFIAHIIPKGKNRTAPRTTPIKKALKKQKNRPISSLTVITQGPTYSAASSSEPTSTPEQSIQTGACSSSSHTSPVISRGTRRSKVDATQVLEETSSLIRIYDYENNITLALFKLETPTAYDISLYNKTASMKLWLTSPHDALTAFGYLDESHKNYTPSPALREEMKNYHAFTELADNFVTHCGICQSYERRDGTIHQAICMPGAMYFADGPCKMGIFTYLIDPNNNQLYHRMFHECSGEKIISEYQARGYWDIDPELGQA